jgi:internalin A
MTRLHALIVVALAAELVPGLARSDETKSASPKEEQEAADSLEALGAHLKRDEGRVAEVDFARASATAEHFKLLPVFGELTSVGIGKIPLTDDVISDLAALPKLTSLRVSAKQGAERLSHLDRLQHVTRVAITDPIALDDGLLGEIRFPAKLERLELLSASKVTNAGLLHIAKLTELRRLDLGARKVTDAGLLQLRGFVHLRRLYLGGTSIKGSAFRDLPWKAQIEGLGGEFFSDENVECLDGFNMLGELNLGGSKITDKGLQRLPALPKLKSLDLQSTSVSDGGLAELARFETLESIGLNNCKITDEGLKNLQRVKKLKRVEIGWTQATAAGVRGLQEAVPGVVVFQPTPPPK